jgi:hypothetical protein
MSFTFLIMIFDIISYSTVFFYKIFTVDHRLTWLFGTALNETALSEIFIMPYKFVYTFRVKRVLSHKIRKPR